jgi:ABC-2 type transport system permease protein
MIDLTLRPAAKDIPPPLVGTGLSASVKAGARAMWWAMRSGLADFSIIFTVWTWLFGWGLRILAQVLFYLVIGTLLGPGQGEYLMIGNTVCLMAVHSLLASASLTWERQNGTLPLLVASPTPPALVLIGRSLFWIPDGLVCAMAAFVILGPVAGLHFTAAALGWTALLLVVTGVACYGLGCFLGSLMLVVPDLRNVVGNGMVTVMMILCGVNLPHGALGPAAQAVANCLPLTHGLSAIRLTLSHGGASAEVGRQALLELAAGSVWLVLAVVALQVLARRSRRDGRALFQS